MKKAFDEGWGAVIAKTVSLDSSKARNARVLLGYYFHHAMLCDRHTSPKTRRAVRFTLCSTAHADAPYLAWLRPGDFCTAQVVNVTPRYARLKAADDREVQPEQLSPFTRRVLGST